MPVDRIKEVVERVSRSDSPRIELIDHAQASPRRLGVFASSFNPPTIAHVELVRQAAETYSLDEVLAVASHTNADKSTYDCSFEDRVAMLQLAFADSPRASIGLSSHAFYVDMIEALERVYPPGTGLHFIVGFDTFERVLDLENRYTDRYHRRFNGREEALEYVFERSSFIVAARAGAGLEDIRLLVESQSNVPRDRILYLDFPADLGELSATEVRNRRRGGVSISELVPALVGQFISRRELYKS